jgi:hypothetical protein
MKTMISRRNVLRGAGIALTLPWMESLVPREARGQAVAAPKRFIPIYFPNGAGLEWWDIVGTGSAWMPGPMLKPLLPVKAKTLVIKNLGNYTWRRDLMTMMPAWYSAMPRVDLGTLMPAGSYNLPSHSRQPGAMLTCVDTDGVKRDLGLDVLTSPVNSITADQVVAQKLAAKMAIPKGLQIGLLNGKGDFDQRNSVYSQNMSWSDAQTPMGKELDPLKIFNTLVSAGAVKAGQTTDPVAAAEAAKRRALDKSALDSLTASATTLQMRMSTADRMHLDNFLTGVRDLEQRATAIAPAPTTAGCTPIAQPASMPDGNVNANQRMAVMNDLIVMALQCDVTRVISYMLDNSRSDLVYSWVPRFDFTHNVPSTGTAGDYHASQHGGLRNIDFASITNWHVGVAADLAKKMDAIQEGTGTLLDNSLLMLFSDMHHGDHAGFDLPCALIGGTGTFVHDQYVVLPEDAQMARQFRDLYFTIMNSYLQLGVTSFGDDLRKIPNAVIKEILVA